MLSQLEYPRKLKYSSDSNHLPIEFYLDTIPHCKRIDLKLGYFSSNAIRTLSYSFAQFIFNGGTLRIVTNHYLSKKDNDILVEIPGEGFRATEVQQFLTKDLARLEEIIRNGEQHFFDCLKYLRKNNRLIIQPVMLKPKGMVHYKEGLLYDGKDTLFFEGSCNFTYKGLVENAESISIWRSWGENNETDRIKDEQEGFETIITRSNDYYKYLSVNEIEEVIFKKGQNKNLDELIEEELTVLKKLNDIPIIKRRYKKHVEEFEKKVFKQNSEPKFPFEGKARDYQNRAYTKWVENNYKGIFAMATGTGKTITSLNCLLNMYKDSKYYQCIIVVPTLVLLSQWIKEVKKFNFDNVFTSSASGWEKDLSLFLFLASNGEEINFIFITTYASFNSTKTQRIIRNKKLDNVLLIADEVHNLGSRKSINNIAHNITQRIGLSATPNRKYDDHGSNVVEEYFNSFSPCYTFSFPLLRAINENYLTKYEYYPFFASLTYDEIKEYKGLSKELLKHYDFKRNVYKESAEFLLIQRKRIIHQAQNKKIVFREILDNLIKLEEGNLSHTLVYVPEGYEHDYSEADDYNIADEDLRIINEYSKIINEYGLTTYQILSETKERDEVLDRFNKGRISVLTAMKTLDEGVDVPATRNAIFCASTGNPRQFIQRRGRILRRYEEKEMARIYDIVIVPSSQCWEEEPIHIREKLQIMEKNIFRSEIYRIANFLYACENRQDLSIGKDENLQKIVELASKFEIDLDGLIIELIQEDNNCN
ncbi:DEAD/DEAH box helicase family protein [uncultured Draconibacterium sp.]|uniref:DEAD/DEAH box helicase family protein n=1 Tax=uncultured Draconibacterium sp. TaxID=1573823 RepID=UPI002AA64415|nr:DEAD/DEAH box helicase family protein [uncultured Draconibacterium sp.]